MAVGAWALLPTDMGNYLKFLHENSCIPPAFQSKPRWSIILFANRWFRLNGVGARCELSTVLHTSKFTMIPVFVCLTRHLKMIGDSFKMF